MIIDVPLDTRQYRIHLTSLLAGDVNGLQEQLAQFSTVQWLTNTTVEPLYGAWRQKVADGGVPPIIIADGEAYKIWATLETILSQMLAHQLDRKSALVALGGGVVGDIGGLAAALYQRGIAVIQIPTTLLSMVDSSVGGKTAVNHPLGKNMIGVMHQPRAVWIDANFLHTLPAREYQAGLAEVVKYGLLGDAAFFSDIEANIAPINARDPDTLTRLIAHSCRMKADIVVRDENEQGERALLNFGHTFGHAIENLTHYHTFLHGEAVAIGMVMAAELSRQLGMIHVDEVARIRACLTALGLPVAWKNPFATREILQQNMLAAMAHDKKTVGGTLRLILLNKLGEACISTTATKTAIGAAIDAVTD